MTAQRDSLLRTNPVWCLDRRLEEWRATIKGRIRAPSQLRQGLTCLSEQGIRVPAAAVQRWAQTLGLAELPATAVPAPGVVGLLFDERGVIASGSAPHGFVTPLTATPSRSGWQVPAHLPFHARQLQDLLLRLVRASTLSGDRAVPERLAFHFHDELGQWAQGSSMDVAGLLAILDTVSRQPALLRCACAVVQLDGDRLGPVGYIREKLDAFCREYGRGTLLVWHPDSSEVPPFLDSFEDNWPVRTLADLADRANAPSTPLLTPLLSQVTLSRTDLELALHYLDTLCEREHRFAEAYDLARRLRECDRQPDVPAPLVRRLERTAGRLSRLLGFTVVSEELAHREVERLAGPTVYTSYDERADAAVVLAASLYDLHRFEEMRDLLQWWKRHIEEDELRIAPETRVKVFNTLARAYIALGVEGWDELIERSLAILEQRNPNDRGRALCYRAHGLLHINDLDQASRVIEQIRAGSGAGPFITWMRAFLEADLARRTGRRFVDPDMEQFPAGGQFKLPLGSYLQATARQRGCPDPADRFRRAADIFRSDVGSFSPTNLLHCLASLMDLAAAAWCGPPDVAGWQEALGRLRKHLAPRPGFALAEHYGELFAQLTDDPDRDAVERLLCRVPHF